MDWWPVGLWVNVDPNTDIKFPEQGLWLCTYLRISPLEDVVLQGRRASKFAMVHDILVGYVLEQMAPGEKHDVGTTLCIMYMHLKSVEL